MTSPAWRCEAHGTVNTGDCPRCDDELIALTEEATTPRPQCNDCERVLVDGEVVWADDWTVIGPEGVRSETRYTCDDCAAKAVTA